MTSIPFIGIVSFTPRSSRNVSSCQASRVLPFGAACPTGAPNTTAARTASPAPMRRPIISVRIATSGAPILRMVRVIQEPQRTFAVTPGSAMTRSFSRAPSAPGRRTICTTPSVPRRTWMPSSRFSMST